jgi:ABC-type transport system involved in multi-copper enzyme maturation permease subunit
MIGPVFALELLHASRRGRQHRFRLAYGGWVGVEFVIFAALYGMRLLENITNPAGAAGSATALGELTGYFLALLMLQQGLLAVLAIPAFAAGTITEEKTRGTLQQLLTTGLTPAEIVAGKLLGPIVRVVDLSLPGWLLLCFVAAFAGLDPLQFLALAGGVLAPLPALGAAGLLASVWCRRTTNAAVLVYGVAGLVAAVLGVNGVLTSPAGPLAFLGRGLGPVVATQALREMLLGWAVCLGVALPLLALATWRLRPAYVRQLTAAPRRALLPWPRRPPVHDHPVRWKEQYVERVLDIPVLRRVPRGLGVAAVFFLTLLVSYGSLLTIVKVRPGAGLLLPSNLAQLWDALWGTVPRAGSGTAAFAVQGLVVMLLAGMAAGARTCGAISGERERQTWEPLLLTPLTAKQLVRSKLWGTINVFRPYLAAYALPAVALSLLAGVPALVWTVTFWAMTWVVMYYMAATGIACSVRSSTSWKSWLTTLLEGYRGLLARFLLVGLPLGLFLGTAFWAAGSLILWEVGAEPGDVAALMAAMADYAPLLPLVVTGLFLFMRTEQLLEEAERQLDRTDRVAQRLRVRSLAPVRAVVPS